MEEQGYIATDEYSEAIDKGLGLNPGDKYQVIHDAFLFDLVQQELIERYGINTVRNGGLKAYTTIDPDLQAKAEEAVEDRATSATPKAGRPPASPRSTRKPARSSPSPRPKATPPKTSSTTPGRRTASPAPRSRPSS